MRWFSIVNFLVLLLLLTGCDNMFRGFGYPVTDAQLYKKLGTDEQETSNILNKCGNSRWNNSKESPEVNMNNYLKFRFCMEDNGFTIPRGLAARDGCLNYANYHKNKLPICIARGAYE